MIVQEQSHKVLKCRAKKPENRAVSSNVHPTVIVNVFKEKGAALSHNSFRRSSLHLHPGKAYNPSRMWQSANQHQTHGVELTDDVIIIGRDGRRVLPPAYATLRIDQLPQFIKE